MKQTPATQLVGAPQQGGNSDPWEIFHPSDCYVEPPLPQRLDCTPLDYVSSCRLRDP